MTFYPPPICHVWSHIWLPPRKGRSKSIYLPPFSLGPFGQKIVKMHGQIYCWKNYFFENLSPTVRPDVPLDLKRPPPNVTFRHTYSSTPSLPLFAVVIYGWPLTLTHFWHLNPKKPSHSNKIKCNLVSISSTFYEQLLHAQIPNAQKDSQVVSLFCAFGICTSKSCS